MPLHPEPVEGRQAQDEGSDLTLTLSLSKGEGSAIRIKLYPPGLTLMNGVALPGIMVCGRWPSHFSAVTSAGRPGLSRSASPRARIADASASPCAFTE